MADVVALELEAGAEGLADLGDDALNPSKGVGEDEVARHAEIASLPVVAELADPLLSPEEPKVHRAHVEGADLRLQAQRPGHALVESHAEAGTGRDIDDGIAVLLDARR